MMNTDIELDEYDEQLLKLDMLVEEGELMLELDEDDKLLQEHDELIEEEVEIIYELELKEEEVEDSHKHIKLEIPLEIE